MGRCEKEWYVACDGKRLCDNKWNDDKRTVRHCENEWNDDRRSTARTSGRLLVMVKAMTTVRVEY